MVLGELSSRISDAIRQLNTSPVVDEAAIDACLKEIGHALLASDVNVKYVVSMRQAIRKKMDLDDAMSANTNKRRMIQRLVFEELTNLLAAERKPLKLKKGVSNVVMFVGLQGSGKTTTCTKFAHYYSRKGWKVCMVCADTFRAGAFDQLKQNATKAHIPFYGSHSETDPVRIAEDGVELFRKERYELIIVDTSGRHKQEQALFDEMVQVSEAVSPDEVVFVMDSHIGQACYDQAQAFATSVDVGAVIVTKLDGHANGGGALSAVAATNAPIIFIGTGEHFDDFEPFEAASFVSRLLGLGDIKGLSSLIQEILPEEKEKEMLDKIQKGSFSLRDLYEQFQSVTKVGSFGKMFAMVPGMTNMSSQQEKDSVTRLKRFMTIMDSMTDDELDCKVLVEKNPSRTLRLAKGAGVYPWCVQELIMEYKRVAQTVERMAKSGLAGKSGDLTNMMRNPKQVMAKLKQSVDPQLLNQFGGADNFFNMMMEMEKEEEAEKGNYKLTKRDKAARQAR